MQFRSLPAAIACAAFALAAGARANTNNNEPGSLLVFPIFDNTGGATILSVVNTNSDFTPVGPGPLQYAGSVRVEFVYISDQFCLEFNRTRTLTPNDSFTVATNLDNPGMERGYVYVFAKSFTTGQAIKWDWLIGTEWRYDGTSGGAYDIAPYVYKGGMRLAQGSPTDVDNDGIRDLNGFEYERSPDEILVPRFFGQTAGNSIRSDLILINLTGGSQFYATVNFLVYNDNEDAFSAQYTFRCWARVPLLTINGVFSNDFLLSSAHNASETTGITVMQSPIEAGWYRMDGGIASSSAASFPDPAFLALQVESVGDLGKSATLPYTTGSQANGDLLPHGVLGDSN